jgi:DHA1 family bicyclomycin/chloramphenicol resistance-like MFS transporter
VTRRSVGPVEFTALVAFAMALTAVGIDLMLPAFDLIRADLGVASDSTEVGGIVTTYFLGLSLGGLAYGPLSDRYGRKPMLYLGYGIYAAGALASAVVPSLGWLCGRSVVALALRRLCPDLGRHGAVVDPTRGDARTRTPS